MTYIVAVVVMIASYLIGAIPFGWVIVKLTTGRDLRKVESGRTGGTNAWRAAGLLAGLATAILDVAKGAVSVWISHALIPVTWPYHLWVEIFAPFAAILGHNYSIYLIERRANGKLHLRGGAGGAPALGGAIGLWFPALFIILPIGAVIYFTIGYASVTTMSVALLAIIIFAVKFANGTAHWQYILYGVLAEIALVWALRPNIQRLIAGTERVHGLRVWLKKKKQSI
jgi:acyl phosphate:glycerol-3-phosphate acyltransferase